MCSHVGLFTTAALYLVDQLCRLFVVSQTVFGVDHHAAESVMRLEGCREAVFLKNMCDTFRHPLYVGNDDQTFVLILAGVG